MEEELYYIHQGILNLRWWIYIQVRSQARRVHFSCPTSILKSSSLPSSPICRESHIGWSFWPQGSISATFFTLAARRPPDPSIHPSIHLFVHSMNVMKCQLIGPELSSKVNKATLSLVPGFSCHQRTPQTSLPNETFHSPTPGSPVTMRNLYLSNASYVSSMGLVRVRLLPWRVLRKQPRQDAEEKAESKFALWRPTELTSRIKFLILKVGLKIWASQGSSEN